MRISHKSLSFWQSVLSLASYIIPNEKVSASGSFDTALRNRRPRILTLLKSVLPWQGSH